MSYYQPYFQPSAQPYHPYYSQPAYNQHYSAQGLHQHLPKPPHSSHYQPKYSTAPPQPPKKPGLFDLIKRFFGFSKQPHHTPAHHQAQPYVHHTPAHHQPHGLSAQHKRTPYAQNPYDLYENPSKEFLCNRGQTPMSLQRLWNMCSSLTYEYTDNDHFLSNCPDYIQWMFPNSRRSDVAPHVEPVAAGQMCDGSRPMYLHLSFTMILNFYGLEFESQSKTVRKNYLFGRKAHNWLKGTPQQPNHN